LGLPLGGAAMGTGFLAQEPLGTPLGIPWWVWILLFVLVIVVAVIWVLRDEKEKAAPVIEEPEAPPEAEAEPVEEPVPAELEAEPASVAAEESETAGAETEVGAAAVAVAEEPEAVEEAGPTEAAVGAAAVATAAVVAAGEPEPVEPDDLQRIDGIGPKISGVLQAAGITTYAQLAGTDVSRLQGILDEAGISRIADASSWPEQARLASAGEWAGLEALQGQLKGGRRVES
jgi:predicted flap endonuclease-1-like 5' DNA nuclease